jgi:glycosyltransferase involved in cell wall biosynthesis
LRIAFYAPLKAPDHPNPSGDRRMAQLLVRALEMAGHEVSLACRLRTWEGRGELARQERLQALGERAAKVFLKRIERGSRPRPDLWFTYHLYDKAPDWTGPAVATTLGIPYVTAEASLKPSRAQGPWAMGHAACLRALEQSAAVITLNPRDAACLGEGVKQHALAPFLDETPFAEAAKTRAPKRKYLSEKHGLDPSKPWILAVAMMRPGAKMASYRMLARACLELPPDSAELLLAGDGAARQDVEFLFRRAYPARFLGQIAPDDLPALYGACDLLAWPACEEAYGMALLEAQAAGLPLVVGRDGGVASVIADGKSALAVMPGDVLGFRQALLKLIEDASLRARMSAAARDHVQAHHSLEQAAHELAEILTPLSNNMPA